MVKRREADLMRSENGRTPDSRSPVSLPGSDSHPSEAFIYDRDAALLGLDNCAKFLVGQNEYWLYPVPLHPEKAMTLVMHTMVELSNDQEWLSLLLKSSKPIQHILVNGGQCFLTLDKNRKFRHVSVEYSQGALSFTFPPFGLWTAASLDWMIDKKCPRKRLDCHPAPWRGTPCPCSGSDRKPTSNPFERDATLKAKGKL